MFIKRLIFTINFELFSSFKLIFDYFCSNRHLHCYFGMGFITFKLDVLVFEGVNIFDVWVYFDFREGKGDEFINLF